MSERINFTPEASSQPFEIDGKLVELGKPVTIGLNGEMITGTVTNRTALEDGIEVTLEDITEPEQYRNRTGNFRYSTHSKRWEAI